MSAGLQLCLPLPPLSASEAFMWRQEVDRLTSDLGSSWPEVVEVRTALDAWLSCPRPASEERLGSLAAALPRLDHGSRKLPRLKRLVELGIGGGAAEVLAERTVR